MKALARGARTGVRIVRMASVRNTSSNKNLRAHGLVQAYSRTNRILNSVKTYGKHHQFP